MKLPFAGLNLLPLQVEAEFLPWLTQQAVSHIERGLLARAVVAQLVADAVALKENQEEGAVALADAQAAAAEAYAAKVNSWLPAKVGSSMAAKLLIKGLISFYKCSQASAALANSGCLGLEGCGKAVPPELLSG